MKRMGLENIRIQDFENEGYVWTPAFLLWYVGYFPVFSVLSEITLDYQLRL
jgi:hypothetical protein